MLVRGWLNTVSFSCSSPDRDVLHYGNFSFAKEPGCPLLIVPQFWFTPLSIYHIFYAVSVWVPLFWIHRGVWYCLGLMVYTQSKVTWLTYNPYLLRSIFGAGTASVENRKSLFSLFQAAWLLEISDPKFVSGTHNSIPISLNCPSLELMSLPFWSENRPLPGWYIFDILNLARIHSFLKLTKLHLHAFRCRHFKLQN